MPLILLKAKTMVAINQYEYYYVQSKNSIMRNEEREKTKQKLQDKLNHFDHLLIQVQNMNLEKTTKENFAIFATNSLLAILPELEEDLKRWYQRELKIRKISKYIKVRNLKQFIKKIILKIKF